MINWCFYPKSCEPTPAVKKLVNVFQSVDSKIDSTAGLGLHSNAVLAVLRQGLESIGYKVERGKSDSEKIMVPVLFGINGTVQKAFHADALNTEERFVLEVEAGRGVVNNQFLKDLFQACMMHDVDYLCIAVCNQYGHLKNFETVIRFFDTMYASRRLNLPLKGILIIGY